MGCGNAVTELSGNEKQKDLKQTEMVLLDVI